MLEQIALGALLLVITTVIHAIGMGIAFRLTGWAHAERWNLRRAWTVSILTAGFVLMMFLAAILEATVWAGTYLVSGAFDSLEPAFYFSMVTYTTLGFGDIVLDPSWRILSAIEAANGIVMFGWTTALIFWFVQRLWGGHGHHTDAGSGK
jgi:hypothetical protein